MRLFRDIKNLPSFRNAVITIGSYDGVHAGHQKIIKRINHLAKELDGESIIVTFDPHPRKVIYPKDNTIKLLNTLEEKIALCEAYGVDNMVVVPFSIEFSQQDPREYIEKFLISKFNPAAIVIGYDHRYGLNRAGNFDLLKQYKEAGHYDLFEIKKQELDDLAISSTAIRNAITDGDVSKANQLLNHKYMFSGTVVHGDKIGQTIGYPTANIQIADKDKLIPKDGVYAVKCNIEGLDLDGMMYIGKRPTVDGTEGIRKIEVNLFDFSDTIYGKKISVDLIEQVRGDLKFDSLDDLKNQLAQDEIDVKNILGITQVNTSDKDRICIAILNYNGEEYLESYLPGILYSSEEMINIAVIDNASTDESAEYVAEYHPEIQWIDLAKNYGFAEGYNRGMKYIDAEYTVILNSDVKVTNEWLDPLIARLDADKTIGIVQPKIKSLEEKSFFEYAGASGGFLDVLGYPYCRGRIFDTVEEDTGQYDNPIDIDWASGAAMVIRTDLYKKLGGFDNSFFAHMEEIDLCTRVRAAGYSIKVIPQSVVYHLGGGTLNYGNEQKIFLNFRNSLLTLVKNESGSQLLWKIPARLILDGISAIKFLLEGKPKSILAILKAHFSFYGRFLQTNNQRNEIRNVTSKYSIGPQIRSASPSKSIVLDYFAKGKKKYSDL